ncbi:hypothetical protein PVAP13_7KG166855 [Panicum virgatum]|uniref:AIG1-type G domain-containing protein n=1 Tax=Panicum virgatum TaxID=38727 RepID=A0A8T0QN17_PANVG|nr:hypothetical protein PVAP13_7KG166855 [Panicum virgatum]
MARDGMHAMLMVFSATSRFSHEDEKTIEAIKMFFDDTIIDHLILVFTNGDRIGEDSWNKMLTDDDNCPKYLQDVLKQCKNRLKKLLDMVDSIVSSKCGKPFSNVMFARIKKAYEQKFHAKGGSAKQVSELRKDGSYDEYFAPLAKMVEEKLNKTIEKMEKQLCEEKKARQKAEERMTQAMLESKEEMSRLRLNLEKAREENKKYRESENVRREKDEETQEEIKNLKEKLNHLEKLRHPNSCGNRS